MDYQERVLKMQDCKIVHYEFDFTYELSCESTVDCFDLYKVLQKGEPVDICENVYHSEDGMMQKVAELIIEETGITICMPDEYVDMIDWEHIANELGLITNH